MYSNCVKALDILLTRALPEGIGWPSAPITSTFFRRNSSIFDSIGKSLLYKNGYRDFDFLFPADALVLLPDIFAGYVARCLMMFEISDVAATSCAVFPFEAATVASTPL